MVLLVSALYCPNLTYVDASYAPSLTDQTVRTIAEATVALQSVLLNGAQNISNSAIEHLVRYHKTSLVNLHCYSHLMLSMWVLNIRIPERIGLWNMVFYQIFNSSTDYYQGS